MPRKTKKQSRLRRMQTENARLRRTLGRLSTRDMQPDEAYRLNATQLKSQRKEFTALIRSLQRGGGDEEDFFRWVQSQKKPTYNGDEILKVALARGVREHGLTQEASDALMAAYRSKDAAQQGVLEEVLVKFGGVDRSRAKEIVGR